MSTTAQLVIVSIWLASGLLAALIMARRGHRHWYWTLLAVLLGPMALPVLAERRAGESTHTETLLPGHVAPGLHLLVGIDGSPAAARAAMATVGLLRTCLGHVTLATVVDYDADAADGHDRQQQARTHLGAVATTLEGWEPAQAVLIGPPVEALAAFATDQHADLIAVGPIGHGLSQRLLGSVTTGLLARAAVPVLVIGGRPSPPEVIAPQATPLHPASGTPTPTA